MSSERVRSLSICGNAPPLGRSAVDEQEEAAAARILIAELEHDPRQGAAALYARYASEVNRMVWRLLGADADHNDMVQRVFVKAFTKVHTLRDPAKLTGWMRSITVNTVYEELRQREMRRLLLGRSRTVELHGDLVRDVEVRDFLLRAKSVIQKLPAKERIVFLLHHTEEMQLQEVAATLGFSVATTKRRLKAARERLRRLLRADPELSAMFFGEEDS